MDTKDDDLSAASGGARAGAEEAHDWARGARVLGPGGRAGGKVCTDCGAAVVDVARHQAWHRRAERREQETRQLGDEVDYLRDELRDARASLGAEGGRHPRQGGPPPRGC